MAGWEKVDELVIQRDSETMELLVTLKHTGNYTTGGGPTLDYGKYFSDIGYGAVVDHQGYSPIVKVLNKTNITVVLHYYDYNNAADGPTIEIPNATSTAVTALKVVLRGRFRTDFPPASAPI